MSGNVPRRANGEWEYRFDIEPDPLTGRRRRRTKLGFATKREASQAMNQAIVERTNSYPSEKGTR